MAIFRDITPVSVLVGTPYTTGAGISNLTIIPSTGASFTITSGATVSQAISGPISIGVSGNWQMNSTYPSITITAIAGPLTVFQNADIDAFAASSGGAVAGDATAANQATQINQFNLALGAKTLVSLVSAAAGAIPINSIGFAVTNTGFLSGVFNGAALAVGESVSSQQVLAAAIAYDATGTSFRIDYFS